MSLRYPKELNSNAVDYVVFRSEEYRTNRQTAGGNGPTAGAPTQGASIALYMPTSTPSVNQTNDWGVKVRVSMVLWVLSLVTWLLVPLVLFRVLTCLVRSLPNKVVRLSLKVSRPPLVTSLVLHLVVVNWVST